MRKKIDPVVDEAIETLNMKDGPSRRRLLEGAGLFSATAAASGLIAACTSSGSSSATPTQRASAANVVGNFPKTPAWKFWFVNHADTNAFFTPTPGTGNIQPRYDGAVSVLGSSFKVHEVATSTVDAQELSTEKAYLLGHKSIKGAFAVDNGSTANLTAALTGAGLKIPAGGF